MRLGEELWEDPTPGRWNSGTCISEQRNGAFRTTHRTRSHQIRAVNHHPWIIDRKSHLPRLALSLPVLRPMPIARFQLPGIRLRCCTSQE
jgi:hypothetical protein